MASDLDFLELFRLARVQEAKVAFISNDPLTYKLIDYINKIQNGTFEQSDFDICLEKKLPDIIKYIKVDSNLYTEENLIKALRIDGLLLGYIPNTKQTNAMCEAALSNNGLALGYVAYDLLTENLIKIALRQNPESKEMLIRIYNSTHEDESGGGSGGGGNYTLKYDSSTKQISLKKGSEIVSSIDASIFLVDSAIKSIGTVTNPSGKPEGIYLKFVFTTEEGEEETALINISEMVSDTIQTELAKKVDKEPGKGLSSNDYTTTEKEKLAGLSNYDDTSLSNRVSTVEGSLDSKVDKVTGKSLIDNTLITKISNLNNVSQLTNDAGYLTEASTKEIAYTKTEIDNKLKNITNLKIPSTFTVGDKVYELTIDDTKDELVLTKVITKHLIDEKVSFTLSQTSFHYNGEERRPEIEVRYDGTLLEEGIDFTVNILNDEYNVTVPIEKGEYYVEIRGKGWYDEIRRETFEIID